MIDILSYIPTFFQISEANLIIVEVQKRRVPNHLYFDTFEILKYIDVLNASNKLSKRKCTTIASYLFIFKWLKCTEMQIWMDGITLLI